MDIKVNGSKLTITVDLKDNQGLSKSEKNIIIDSTRGIRNLENGIQVGLNVFKVNPNYSD